MKILITLVSILTLSACSLPRSQEDAAVHSDDLEFAVDTLADKQAPTDIKVEEEKVVVAENSMPEEFKAPISEEPAMVAPTEPTFGEFKKPEEPKEVEVPQEIKILTDMESPSTTQYGSTEVYKMQKGDTLMMVAYKIYGDYHKWKEIKSWNTEVKRFVEGVDIKYKVPAKKFVWEHVGLPYLIKTGNTLGSISVEKYGTPKKWKAIYENNRPLIKNPNLIFAGFTIYYQPTRELASEPK